jgi:hypothetical protein
MNVTFMKALERKITREKKLNKMNPKQDGLLTLVKYPECLLTICTTPMTLPRMKMGMHSMVLVRYPVNLSIVRLNLESQYASVMFSTSPVLATCPAIPVPTGNL